MIEVREATVDDAEAIADAHIAAWRVGYRDIFPAAYLASDGFEEERRTIWRSRQWSAENGQALFAGVLDGRVVGFALAGPDREQPAQGEVYAFYVHPDAWGSGIAAALMDAAVQSLRDRGFTQAILWTLRDNPRARGFYEKAGWTWNGTETTWTPPANADWREPDPVADVQYERDL